MRPAFSVVFLTTLIGAGQGLLVALFMAEAAARAGWIAAAASRDFFVAGAATSIALAFLGLVASFFHLGRPERAWRTATMWRTSWLSREVIALPVFMAATAAYGAAHWAGHPATLAIGALALAACAALFVCTGMIYACIKFFQEWATPLTLVNFALLGTASGFMLATPLAAALAPALAAPLGVLAAVFTLAGLAGRALSLARNARLRPRSTLQSAIGIHGARIAQRSQGFTGGSFNTREFFHRLAPRGMDAVRTAFLQLAFVVPLVLLGAGFKAGSLALLASAFAVQYAGLVAERWYFLAQSTHPQNLYYQSLA